MWMETQDKKGKDSKEKKKKKVKGKETMDQRKIVIRLMNIF